jgi:hypothetical protein
MKNLILLGLILAAFLLVSAVFAETVCPTIVGWKIVNNTCISDYGCDYDLSGNTTYYGTKEICLSSLNCTPYFTCPNGTRVPWCGLENNKCVCIISPENQCAGYCNEGKEYACPNGTKVPWCGCENHQLVCIISPENQCPKQSNKSLVLIFVDENTYNNLAFEIERYKSDIINDLDVDVLIYKNNLSDLWFKADQVRNIILKHYQNDKLLGSVLIGNIPTAYFDDGVLTDWYYEDMSNKFIDTNYDGKFERNLYNLTDITMRDVWSGRIKPPIEGYEGIELLRKYFNRNHAYRTGELTYNPRLLYFNNIAIDENLLNEDEYDESAKDMSKLLYGNDNQVDMIYDKNASARKMKYLSKIILPYEVVFVKIHGGIRDQFITFSNTEITINVSEIKNNTPKSLFYRLYSCYNGRFTDDDYIAGWYLFGGDALAVEANTVPDIVGGCLATNGQLKLGVTLGELHKNDGSFLAWHLLGDPTLKLRQKPEENIPVISPTKINLDFGNVPINKTKEIVMDLTNNGDADLIVGSELSNYNMGEEKTRCSLNGEFYEMPCPLYYYNESGQHGFKIPPHSSKKIRIMLDLSPLPLGTYSKGNYSQITILYTNDPNTPYFYLNLKGNAVEIHCGNNLCEPGETYENCCTDCGCPNGPCINNSCGGVKPPEGIQTKITSDQATNILISKKIIEKATKIENTTSSEQKTIYKIVGQKYVKILGIFPISLDVEVKIDADKGNIISIEKPWWSFLAW